MDVQRLPESELIITEKGCIYHLDLHPDELAHTIITVGDPARVHEISKHFDKLEIIKSHREFISHTGYVGKKRISVVSTGIGPDNIDIVMNELDALVNIDFESRTIKPRLSELKIFRLGTTGSLQSHLPVDSLVVSTHGIGMDNLMAYYNFKNNAEEQVILNEFCKHTGLINTVVNPYIASGAISLLHRFVDNFTHGITVTCPGFYGPQGRILRLPLTYPNLVDDFTTFSFNNHFISNFEMETSAIYGLGKVLGHQCLSINTIIANRINKTFSKDPKKAIEHMIVQSLEVISNL